MKAEQGVQLSRKRSIRDRNAQYSTDRFLRIVPVGAIGAGSVSLLLRDRQVRAKSECYQGLLSAKPVALRTL